MIEPPFHINIQLLNDSHALLTWHQCHIRLHRNASLPWLIIIPESDETEFCELPNDLQQRITQLGRLLGRYLKSELGSEKINFAAIGNVVQQMHVHVIGRHSEDPLWPDVVWGNSLPEVTYNDEQTTRWRLQLKQLLEEVMPC